MAFFYFFYIFFIVQKAAPIHFDSSELMQILKREWPFVFENDNLCFSGVIEQVETLTMEALKNRSAIRSRQDLSRLVLARMISRDAMLLAFTRIKSAHAIEMLNKKI